MNLSFSSAVIRLAGEYEIMSLQRRNKKREKFCATFEVLVVFCTNSFVTYQKWNVKNRHPNFETWSWCPVDVIRTLQQCCSLFLQRFSHIHLHLKLALAEPGLPGSWLTQQLSVAIFIYHITGIWTHCLDRFCQQLYIVRNTALRLLLANRLLTNSSSIFLSWNPWAKSQTWGHHLEQSLENQSSASVPPTQQWDAMSPINCTRRIDTAYSQNLRDSLYHP